MKHLYTFFVSGVLIALAGAPAAAASGDAGKTLYLPLLTRGGSASGCPDVSVNAYGTIAVDGAYYKDNRLTDQNADLRLSVIGYAPTSAPLELVNYNGDTDPNAPKLSGVLRPERVPAFPNAYKRYDWTWDEKAAPPYGARGNVNNDWPVSVIDFATTVGEAVHIPRRSPQIGGGFNAMVLYASEEELTIAYYRQDSVGTGYVIHMLNFCVDPNLVATYRAQLTNGKRATGNLPGVTNDQPVGTAKSAALTVAVRDRGGFLDPRSRKDWWP